MPISEPLQRYVQLSVFVENDANAWALAETWLGAVPSVQNLLYLKTEAGVGASLVVGGQLVTGPRGMAGEIGHIPIMRCGYRCRCGQRDCLETYVYVPDVLARYESMAGQAIDQATFFDMKQSDDPVVAQLKTEAEEALTLALSFAIALLDLDAVVIGGVWGRNTEMIARIQSACQNHAMRTGLNKPITVKGAGIHGGSDLVGAVGLVINRFLSPAWALSNGHLPPTDPSSSPPFPS